MMTKTESLNLEISESAIQRYPRIAEAIYHQPWFCTPEAFSVVQSAFEAHAAKGFLIPASMGPVVSERPVPKPAEKADTAVLHISGLIGKRLSLFERICGGFDLCVFSQQLRALSDDDNVKTIYLVFDTPGGVVVGVHEAAMQIREITNRKKVIAYTDTLCASAGYYLASQASEVVAAPTSRVGSIGVITAWVDRTKQMEMNGEKLVLFYAGKFKPMGIQGRPLTDEESEMIQSRVDGLYDKFVNTVAEKRENLDPDAVEGQVFTGEEAVTLGLVDRTVDTFEDLLLT